MSEKRKRTATLLCTDEAWSSFQALATRRGKTIASLLAEIVEREVAPVSLEEQAMLPDELEGEETEISPHRMPTRTLIGFGQPVVRIR
jgi:hypothetical protein